MTVKCIDISAWQGKIATETFMRNREAIPFVIIRCSYTSLKSFSLHEDKCFQHNIKAAYKAGVKIGIYPYSQAISEAEATKEAKFALKTFEPFKQYITLPIFFDWEFGRRLSAHIAKELGKKECGKICDAFCQTIKKAGFEAGVYANLSTLNAYLPSDLSDRWPIWVAQYNSKCNYKHPYVMWQYSSSGHVSGIDGRVDMNIWYGKKPEPVPASAYNGAFPALPHRGWFTSGDKGEQVKRLQRFLNWYGGYGLQVDGEVGRKTIDAVREYQGREKLKVDGAFGSESLKRAKIVRR